MDDAAKAALDEINPISIAKDKEYGGYIYQNSDGTYSYTSPVKGDTHGIDSLGPVPSNVVADYHTHGAESGPDWDDEHFSNADIASNEASKIVGYLGTPSGKILKYDPKTKKIKIIGKCKIK